MPVKELTAKQKKNLPASLQKAIMAKRYADEKKGKNKVPKAQSGGQLHGADLKKQYVLRKSKVPKAVKGGMLYKGVKSYEKAVHDEYKKNPPPKLKCSRI